MKRFSLYFNKRDKKLIIETITPSNFMYARCTNKVTKFNDCYFICNDRKLLRDKANEIKNTWVEEAEKDLNYLKELKIRTKY